MLPGERVGTAAGEARAGWPEFRAPLLSVGTGHPRGQRFFAQVRKNVENWGALRGRATLLARCGPARPPSTSSDPVRTCSPLPVTSPKRLDRFAGRFGADS